MVIEFDVLFPTTVPPGRVELVRSALLGV